MYNKLKIGYFIDTFYPMIDGVVQVVDNYARRLSPLCDVTVFAPKIEWHYKDNFPYNVVRSFSAPMPFKEYRIPGPEIDLAFRRELERSSLDIVHIHSPFSVGRMGVKYALKNNIPLISTMHSQYKKDFQRVVKNDLVADFLTDIVVNVFDRCDYCWAVNSEVARIFHEDYKCKKLPKVMRNATDMVPESKDSARREITQRYGINENEFILLFVGRINKLKNVMFICDVLKQLRDEGLPFKMLFAGTGEDENEVKDKIREYSLDDKVIFCGKIENRGLLTRCYAAADLFIFPSLYDASSLVQVEAASQKLPAIFLKGAATASTVTNGVNGIIASENEFPSKIIEVLNDKQLYKTISDGAFRDLYITWDDIVREVYESYREIYYGS